MKDVSFEHVDTRSTIIRLERKLRDKLIELLQKAISSKIENSNLDPSINRNMGPHILIVAVWAQNTNKSHLVVNETRNCIAQENASSSGK